MKGTSDSKPYWGAGTSSPGEGVGDVVLEAEAWSSGRRASLKDYSTP